MKKSGNTPPGGLTVCLVNIPQLQRTAWGATRKSKALENFIPEVTGPGGT
jgi:hypothetical protein